MPGVQLEGNQTPRPTKAEANNLLYQELKNLLKAAQTDLDMSNDDINEILTQIKKNHFIITLTTMIATNGLMGFNL